jgi:hypothetical protein
MLWRTLGDALTLGVNEKHLAKFVQQKRYAFGSSDATLKKKADWSLRDDGRTSVKNSWRNGSIRDER